MTGAALALLAACDEPFDFDLRDNANGFDTSRAIQNLPGRPSPDDRGIISYPNYQVVVARQDDTIRGIAIRLGLDANELAEYNGIEPDVILRRDEIIALPTRVAEPSAATGAIPAAGTQPLDVSAIAGGAIDRANANNQVTTTSLDPVTSTPTAAAPAAAPTGAEPIRHQVARGETVFAISRLYNVPVSAIADWNGLDSQFTVREGQFLLIPRGGATPAAAAPAEVTAPGAGTETPVPPSAATPLPEPASAAPIAPAAIPEAPDLGNQTPASAARFSFPVQGSIIRAYAPGSNEGIDIGVPAGTDVKAADAGTVAAVTNNTSGVAIIVVKHSDGLLTVYTNIDNLTVSKGDAVTRGQTIGKVREGDPSFLHFEVRRGLQSVDPTDYLP
ncbi:LysM peptidoglycan-binding domain-containing M23 family metallopeptidase [Yoonia sp. 2307UL14-13]|uniref:LysM peptidoglycan-binding domain-containing M23 family metallopeptidase n=1 Tax=Yoonia sp. 2307UL14-13 TaxID=3126506 RepID=UPI0030B2E6E4